MVSQKLALSESFSKVKTILISSWDPLGIFAEPSAQDEYDSFVPPISNLLRQKVTAEKLSLYLQKIESDDFGLIPDQTKTNLIAILLINSISIN